MAMTRWLCAVLVGLVLARGAEAQTPEYVWLEGEAPTASNIPVKPTAWTGAMSADAWLSVSLEPDAQKTLPDGALNLSYDFTVPSAGRYEAWNRLGLEDIRSPFEWRLDDAAWKSVAPTDVTTDLREIGFWASVGWFHLGDADLAAGKHTLHIRVQAPRDKEGKPQRLLYVSDALCFTKGDFRPHGRFQPGDMAWQTDQDRAAATHAFQAAAPAGAAQTATPLTGRWQWARWDELQVEDRTGAVKALPDLPALYWRSMNVPGDRNKELPDETFAHRYLLRTRVDIPAEAAGKRAVYLHFPSLNMLATLFVNGQQVGFCDTPYALYDCDITHAVKPGLNEIVVAIKDTYYGFVPRDGRNVRSVFMYPTEFIDQNQGVSMMLDYPVWNKAANGILQKPTLVVAGPVYSADVFAKPSVRNKSLGLEITLRNTGAEAATVSVENEAAPLAGGPVAKSFPAHEARVPAGGEAVLKVDEAWSDPKLWWPDDPQQYNLITRVKVNGQVVDERTTKFGFREWEWNGAAFKLNGVPFHGRADLYAYGKADEASVAAWRAHGMNMQRLWGETEWGGKEIEQALDFYDAQGVPIRRTGIFDGEGANYGLVEEGETDGKRTTVPRKALFDNYRRQLLAWAKGQRNHPSIFIWSMENEITFINSKVFGNNDKTDPEMRRAGQELMALDPTRPVMVDGGNALLDESLPVYGGHYMEPAITTLPNSAYDRADMTHRQIWPMTQQKPMLFGEAYYATGTELGTLAAIGGEAAFVGKAEAYPAIGLIGRMLSEGYRWNGVGFHFWAGGQSDLYYRAWQPTAVLCRQWDWTFGAGQRVKRTLGIFNDTRFADPITLVATLSLGGKTVDRHSSVHNVPAGGEEKFDLTLALPAVASRTEGTWTLALQRGGKTVFTDVKAVSVLPAPAAHLNAAAGTTRLASTAPAGGGTLCVYDPAGRVAAFLKARGVAFTPLASLAALPARARALLIGPNALDAASSTSSRLAAWAAAGHGVIALEQKSPLRFQALPGEMQPDKNQGCVAFPEDLGHPLLAGLAPKDFQTWGPDGVLYRDAYNKPTAGGKSLIQCEDSLKDTALAEMTAGSGVMVLSQLTVGEKIDTNPVAQRLLLNMVDYALGYRPVHRPVSLVAANPQLTRAVEAIGVVNARAADPLAALAKPGGIAVVDATPANLRALAANLPRVRQFEQGGGWIILNNVTPDGLKDYNALVGFNHVMRPFKREKVTLPAVRSPLIAGLGTTSVVMYNGEQIFPWQAGQYTDPEAFSYVVDLDEVAPFAKSPFSAWDNITNNFVNADAWKLIINFEAPTDGKPYSLPITLARPETIREFTWVSDTNYQGTTKINLVFDGKDRVSYDVKPNSDPQALPVNPPRTVRELTLEIADWTHPAEKRPDGKELIGIDNIYIKVARPADFYRKVVPLLNVGAMVAYPQGKGGIVLCNVRYKETEAVPENVEKKRAILATLLRNLQAPFRGKTIIAGAANLTYEPISLAKSANAYRTEQGWFGDKQFTFRDLPTGKHTLAGVPYDVYEFATSPVPTVVMLGGPGVPGNLPDRVEGIPVNRKADALFFLQAARIDQRRNPDEVRRDRRFEMADYVIHYADGQTVKVPIYSEIGVDDYRQQSPAALPGAQIAWTRPYPGTDRSAVAYSLQWNNPRPTVAIQSVDLIYGPDRRGIPALLALTAARAGE